MKRRQVHMAFGATALAVSLFTAYEGHRLYEAARVNAVIAGAGKGAGTGTTHTVSDLPEARFVHAMTLARSGDYENALKAYKSLARDAPPRISESALYNAGNLQLREALKEGRNAAIRALPLIELSKQSYRAVLRSNPESWDARYNLERALWLAPEIEESQSDRIRRDAENRVLSTLQSTRADLP